MSNEYKLVFIDARCQKEYLALRGNTRLLVDKGLARLRVRANEIGKPLNGALAGCKELKFRAEGIRVIFRIKNGEVQIVEIIAIGPRDKSKVFVSAKKRLLDN
ncbi:addiction module toxin RelE [Adlercreutzia sp. ZJ304]|uniref:type II toxin-antitoxin system RelE family toxin n=1 Tax=Adlercreutzia sp. ZJ304 TaxID=2709791 RepID=UPI0013EB26FE|nr:addiction module toxin RelE [Adlercreutzia sp. ZJ304]